MKKKWDKSASSPERPNDGQPVAKHFSRTENAYQPKLMLTKSPSMRAISNYNNLSIEDSVENSQNTYENLTFMSEIGVTPTYDVPYASSSLPKSYTNSLPYNSDYTTLGSSSVRTNTSNGSELDSERNEMGSTTKLVNPKMEMPCHTWFINLQTVLCTIALAAGFGNLYRLPQTTLLRGGVPFFVAYIILSLLIGLPLLFLELGIGQLAQEGFIKSYRAVPFFRGVGYVKLIAGCLLSIYYPLYMALSLYYIVWTSKATSLPFQECAVVKIKEAGYSADGIDGQQCLKKTFLESPFQDPYWYGIYAAILFLIWMIVTILSIRRTKCFVKSLLFLLFPTLGCLIALTVKTILTEDSLHILETVWGDIDWTVLKNAEVWYFAATQVFFSTNVGFGSFVTKAGMIYTKVHPIWTALGYMAANLILGFGSVIICYVLLGESGSSLKEGDVSELHLISMIYTVMIRNEEKSTAKIWAIVAYATVLLAGFISMVTMTYTLLKAITVQNKRRMKWWQTSIVTSFVGFFLGCAVLLQRNFQIVRLLDHYVVGNLILICVVIEVLALISFYGTERLKSDFEFMLGDILSKIWLMLWWLIPILLTAIFAWAMVTLPSQDFETDPQWLSEAGWGIVLLAIILIFVVGYYTISKQDGYTLKDRLKSSFKPSQKWGPKDPMLRYTWIQWNSKAQQGERDFTLKRKGTRDYTKSIKRDAKKKALTNASKEIAIVSRTSNASVEYAEAPYLANEYPQLRITSLVDPTPKSAYIDISNPYNGTHKTNLNPLSRTRDLHGYDNGQGDEYGTFRKGPYVIPDSNISHVCHRRYSESEDATEL